MTELSEALLATKWGVVLLQTILRFLRRKILKDIETSKELLSLDNPKIDILSERNSLPMVAFRIPVRKRIYLKLELQRLYIKLICDDTPVNTVFWYKGCNIDDVEATDIEAIGDGVITIRCPCTNIYPIPIHKWELVGEVVFNTKIDDLRREIRLVSSLDRKEEGQLRNYLLEFQRKTCEVVS